MSQRQILSNAGANVASDWITMYANRGLLQIGGTFSGQTVTIETMSPNGEAIPIENGAITFPTTKILDLAKGALFRMSVSNGGTPSISAYITDQQ